MRALALALASTVVLAAQAPTDPAAVGRQIDIAEIERTLHAIDVDRTSGGEGERQSAAYLEKKLDEYGVHHTRYDMKAYLSWPKDARLEITATNASSAATTFEAVTPAFSASTGPAGVTGDVLWLPEKPDSDDDDTDGPLGPEARGKIVVAWGLISPESVLRAQEAGALGVIHINGADVLHEMIATTVWGTPTTSDADRLPRIPVLSITKRDGAALKMAAPAGTRVTLVTNLDRGWTTIPLVVADVPGATDDFVLVATHIDAWYHGMTDTAGTVASILDMARVIGTHRSELQRGVRFAWWPGHSFGRYPGSTWYVDHFWSDLNAHLVAYTNLDGSGRRGSRMDAVSAGGWPGLAEWSRSIAPSIAGKAPASRGGDRLFRPGRDSDSSFQGIGVPEFSIGVPGPPRGHPDTEPNGRIKYWHHRDDTIDKLDMNALKLDTAYRVSQVYALATARMLPLTIAPIARSYVRALETIASAAGASFDLTTTRKAAAALETAADRFDAESATVAPNDAARAARNRLLVQVTHRLNSTLYTATGPFRQDPAAYEPILPLLARAAQLPTMNSSSDAYGFLEAELIRGRNQVEATLTDALAAITAAPGRTTAQYGSVSGSRRASRARATARMR